MDIKELKVSIGIDEKKNHPWEYARSKVILCILKKYLKKSSKCYALDVGCGDAFFLTRFADKYPDSELIAVDTAFSPEIISKIKSKNSINNMSFLGHIQDVTTQEATIVFLLDVIEHIDDDISFLKNLISQTYISSNTVFIITVPAFNSLFCYHDKWLEHHRRYSQKMLKLHAESAGLSCIEGGYFFTSLLIPRFFQNIFEKLKIYKRKLNEIDHGIGNYKGGALISFLYEKYLLLDFYFFRIFSFLGIKIPGLSTYVICNIK